MNRNKSLESLARLTRIWYYLALCGFTRPRKETMEPLGSLERQQQCPRMRQSSYMRNCSLSTRLDWTFGVLEWGTLKMKLEAGTATYLWSNRVGPCSGESITFHGGYGAGLYKAHLCSSGLCSLADSGEWYERCTLALELSYSMTRNLKSFSRKHEVQIECNE